MNPPPAELPWSIRWAAPADNAIRHTIIRRSWEDAYQDIFPPPITQALFNGRIAQVTDWEDPHAARLGSLLIESQGQVVGTASLVLRTGGDGELTSFYVLPEYQGKGLGQHLWQACIQELINRGCGGMQVWVLSRARAVLFYQRRGCTPIGAGTYRLGDQVEPVSGYRLDFSTGSSIF